MNNQHHMTGIDEALDVAAERPAALAPLPPPPPAPVHYSAPPAMAMQQTVINVGSEKSVVGAVILALLFGPLGMLYSTALGAVVMFFVNLVVAVVTLGIGLLLTVPLGAIWAGIAASASNGRIRGAVSQAAAPVR
jgi:hypothetical protein